MRAIIFGTQQPIGSGRYFILELPDRWLETHPEHGWHIAHVRQEERTPKQG